MFEHSYLKEWMVKSVMAGLRSFCVGSSAVNIDTYFSGRKREPSSHACNDLTAQGPCHFLH